MLESVKTNMELLEKVKDLFDDAVTYDRKWQTNAQESFGFRDGWAQWKQEEKDILEQERRPALTLNVTKAHIDLIMGLNADQKKRYICTPVGVEDALKCELINNVDYWLYQKNEWEVEEDNAFESALISGRGWVHIDFNLDEEKLNEIKIVQTSIPVHEVRMDPAARKRDLSDASYVIWDRWLSLEDCCVKYPKWEKFFREAFDTGAWPRYANMDGLTPESGEFLNHDINDESDYSDPLDVQYFDSKKRQMRICHMEYWKYVKQYFVYKDDGTLERIAIPWSDFKKRWAETFPGKKLDYEVSTRKEVWWLQFCGEEILFHGKSPISYPGFSIVPCFMFEDVSRRRGYHYGIVEHMKDPQREINKRVSQTLNLYNQQVQPGVYAESRAFVNTDQAEQSLKEAGSVTWLQDGAIGQKRFMERTVPAFPSAVLQMGEYAREMLRHITGINPDLLGTNDKRQEPGIVVQLRQQQGMAILRPVFNAYAAMKKQLFERRIRIIMEHMPNAQILKILGESGRFQVDKAGQIVDTQTKLTANIRDVQNAAYDIDAEPEDDSMTARSLELATFIEMQKNGIPVDPRVMVGKTNLPVSEKVRWIEYIEGQQQAASEQAQAEMELKKAEIEGKNQIELKKLDLQLQIAAQKAEFQREKDILKASVDQEKLDVQRRRDEQTAQLKLMQIVLQAAQNKADLKQKFISMTIDAELEKKRLNLDSIDAIAKHQGTRYGADLSAIVEIYKARLQAGSLQRSDEVKLVNAMYDRMCKMKESAASQRSDDAQALMDYGARMKELQGKTAADLFKTLAVEANKADIERAKLATQEKTAELQAKTAEAQMKTQAMQADKDREASQSQADKDRKEASKNADKDRMASAAEGDKNRAAAAKNKPL